MDFEKSRIERLKQALYSRDEASVPQEKRTPVPGREIVAPKDWGSRETFALPNDPMTKKDTSSFFTSFFGISLIFFALSLGVAIWIFFGGLNMISSNNVDIKITGPSSIASGDELDADIAIVNSNRTDLLNPKLYIEYPEGTQSVGTTSVSLAHDSIDLGAILSGRTADYSLRAIFFGETNAIKTITFKLEYGIKGSSAVFSKTKTYDISIGSSPLLLNVQYPTSVNSGQTVTFSIDLTSNSSTILPNTIVRVAYPYGFTYSSSNIKTVRNDASGGVWNVGDLQNGDKKTLTISGTLVGQNEEQRSFQIGVGTRSSDPSKDFETQLAANTATIALSKSFYGLALYGGDGSSHPVTSVGQSSAISINFQNTLPDKLVDNQIRAVISGNVFDRGSVASQSGYYKSLDSSITWDKTNLGLLSQLSSGDSGRVSFSVNSLPDPVAIRSIKNPHIDIAVTMSGTRLGNTDTSSISSTANITIRLQSILGVTARVNRSSGPFTNTGPIPPAHDVQSTYTVTWTITNTTNDVDNVVAIATLPQNVSWINQVSPQGERVSYDPNSRTVTWNVGPVSYGTGYVYSPKTVSFQIGLTPSITDVGSQLPLTSQVTVRGTDTYASTTLSTSGTQLDTRFSDPNYLPGYDIVK